MKPLIIGVSGINAVDNPGPGVGVARSLKDDPELEVKIIGLAYDAMEPGIYLDWLIDKSFILPYPGGHKDAFLERLAYIKQSYGLDVIIPNLDAELPVYIKCARDFAALGIRLVLPSEDQFRLRGKDHLVDVAQKINISVPRTEVVSYPEDVHQAVDKLGLPLMVKGAFYKAYRAYTTQEAMGFFYQVSAEWGFPVILQQVVSGEEMNVVGVGDGKGGHLGLIGIKKLWITSLGKIWTGVTIKNELMLKAARDFVAQYKWQGPFELECIVDGDTVYLIEINPRFPAWCYFATGVGVNLPANLVRQATGQPVPQHFDYETGKLYVRYTYEIVTDMKDFQDIVTKGETS